MDILPAYETKDAPRLVYPLKLSVNHHLTLEIQQDDTAGATTGTTVWLGAQVLTAYLLSLFPPTNVPITSNRRKAIDLGSGLGFTSMCLAACGLDVTATDLPILTDGLLSKNALDNAYRITQVQGSGSLYIKALDWMSNPTTWTWPDEKYAPPFDLIVTADSIYSEDLVQPLLQTIKAMSLQSLSPTKRGPDVYLAYEHRDDAQYDAFLRQAEGCGFRIKPVTQSKVRKAVKKLYGWKAQQYEDISVVHMKLHGEGV